jgi:hypothetical protein
MFIQTFLTGLPQNSDMDFLFVLSLSKSLGTLVSVWRLQSNLLLCTHEKSVLQVEHSVCTNIPLGWRFETIPKFRKFMFISVAKLFLFTGSGFFKLCRLAFGHAPINFLSHVTRSPSVCKEHGHTINIKCINDKDSVAFSCLPLESKVLTAIFFSFATLLA